MEYDIAIIGAGPGGYVAAIRSAQLGFKTLLVEKEAVGGVCLNWGCIPTKAMIKNAEVLQTVKSAHNFGISISSFQINYQAGMERVWDVVRQLTNGINGLLKKHQVDLVFGDASLVDDHTISVNNQHINSHSIILATGASPNEIPGIEVDGIVQNVSVSGKTDFTFTVGNADRAEVESVLTKKMQGISYDELIVDEGIGKVSLVGVGMRSHAGIASTAFNALADSGINIQMISTSEIKITIVISGDQLEEAVKTLHSAFNLGD